MLYVFRLRRDELQCWSQSFDQLMRSASKHVLLLILLKKLVFISNFNVFILMFVITRHSLVRAKGEVFVLLLLFCSFFCQRFLDNPRANSRQILLAGVLWFRMCLLPFWGLAAPGGREKGQMKFSLLWESMGNFCILAVFERYLSNACTDPHQILFV